mmetsp:Transcript_5889/g.17690  ORF Transcript_5889/g.17690 Transcript_5889/m.17690 type:complete len:291 (+) Transcript_5889:100-972(+)
MKRGAILCFLCAALLFASAHANGFKRSNKWLNCVGKDALAFNDLKSCSKVKNFEAKVTGRNCKMECRPFEEIRTTLHDGLMQARDCSIARNNGTVLPEDDMTVWDCRYSQIIRKGCGHIATDSNGVDHELFCVNSRMARAVVNSVQEQCIDHFRPVDEADEDDEDAGGVLKCRSTGLNYIFPTPAPTPGASRMQIKGKFNRQIMVDPAPSTCITTGSTCHSHAYFMNQDFPSESCSGWCASNLCRGESWYFFVCLEETMRTGVTAPTVCDNNSSVYNVCYAPYDPFPNIL